MRFYVNGVENDHHQQRTLAWTMEHSPRDARQTASTHHSDWRTRHSKRLSSRTNSAPLPEGPVRWPKTSLHAARHSLWVAEVDPSCCGSPEFAHGHDVYRSEPRRCCRHWASEPATALTHAVPRRYVFRSSLAGELRYRSGLGGEDCRPNASSTLSRRAGGSATGSSS